MIIKCPECGHQVSDQAKTCPSCGIEIAGKVTRCPETGEFVFKKEEETLPAKRPVKKKNTGRVVFILAVVIALVLTFLGFYFYKTQETENEQHAYEIAMKSDEPAVLQNFLDMYAQAPSAHRDSVRSHLMTLIRIEDDWNNALRSGLKSELEKFMRRYPNSVHNVEAEIQIDSLDWVAACMADTQEAYQLYIRDHYDGAYYDEALVASERAREAEEARRRQAILDSIHMQDSIRAAQESSGIGGAIKSILGL